MTYAIRLSSGELHLLTGSPALTNAAVDGLLHGDAELVAIDDNGREAPIDVLGPRPGHEEGATFLRSPLLGIRIKHSEHLALNAGQQFDTIAEFESALRRARREAPTGGRIGFVLTWRDRSTFHGWYDLDLDESLVEHVGRVCRAAREDRLHCLVPGIRVTAQRLFEATVAERLGGSSRRTAQEASWRTLGA